MPGILLNRLSRAKEGVTPEDQLAKGREVLLGEMLPRIIPAIADPVDGKDYLYLEDILSRLLVHQEGEILDRALKVMHAGECSWVAVTEVPRITGNDLVAVQFMHLCRDRRIPIYTRERLYHPFQPWRAASYRELMFAFFLSANEILTYQERSETARARAYPIDTSTGESRMKAFEGIGRHMNGRVPLGYVWDKQTKTPQPDLSIPFPDYIPPDHTSPPAYTWWDIVRMARRIGRSLGVFEASAFIAEATGWKPADPSVLLRIWRNPFYCGRPTSTRQLRGGRLVRRDNPVYTEGDYEKVDTLEEHQELQEAINRRHRSGAKTGSKNWASGILRCACGQPFISYGAQSYRCRGLLRFNQQAYEENRAARLPEGLRIDRHLPIAGWQRTPTCGMVRKEAVHEHLESELRRLFKRTDLPERIAEWQTAQEEVQSDRKAIHAQIDALTAELARIEQRRVTVIDLAVDGTISKVELKTRQEKLEKERRAIEARTLHLREQLELPSVTSTAADAIRLALTVDFGEFWREATEQEKALIASSLIQAVPVTGTAWHKRFGATVWPAPLRP